MTKVDALLPEHIKSSLAEVDNESDSEVNMERVPFAKNAMHNDLKHLNQLISRNKVHVEVIVQNKENMSSKSVKTMSSQEEDASNNNETSTEMGRDRSSTPTNETESPTGAPLTPTANLKVLFNAMSPELRDRDTRDQETVYAEEFVEIENDSSECVTGQPAECLIGQPMVVIKKKPAVITHIMNGSQEIVETVDLSKYVSRKEKSLGLLCQKFLQKYPEYPKPNERYDICLDEVAKELQVERRRIYDIVNVLESVEIVSRVAKNKYAWHGKTNLQTTLAKLKALGDSEGFAEQIQKLKDFEFNREIEEQLGRYAPKSKPAAQPDFTMFGESSLFNPALRKDKSLGIMSQKFLMLFLVSQPKTVNLDLSAKLLIGDATIDKTENAKFKTKIRRLYDIANILTSLNLIRKVHVTEIRGRKPAFKYIGPDIDNCEELHICSTDGCHRPSSRHSMLDCVQNQSVANIMSAYRPIKPSGATATSTSGKTTDSSSDASPSPTKSKFGRHSSFEQICAVAEHERKKLIASASEPASPTEDFKEELKKMSPQKDPKSSPESTNKPKQFILMQSVGGQFRMVEDASTSQSSDMQLPKVKTVKVTKEIIENKLPTKGFVRKKSKVTAIQADGQTRVQTVPTSSGTNTKISSGSDTIIIKTSNKMAAASGKQPTVIPLTKDQIDAVLRSLKVPVPVVNKEQGTLIIDAATQSSPVHEENTSDSSTSVQTWDAREVNETTPITTVVSSENGIKRQAPASESIPAEKRIKLEFPSPPTSEDDKSPSCHPETATLVKMKRKSLEEGKTPQRALHLTPEFNNPPKTGSKTTEIPSSKAEIELAVPLQHSEDSNLEVSRSAAKSGSAFSPVKSDQQSVGVKSIQGFPTQTVTVQLPNRAPTVLHLPIVNMASQGQQIGTQQVHIIQSAGTQVGAGQQLGVVVPCTFSPPLTPSNDPTSPNLFTFPTSQNNTGITFTNVHLVQSPVVKLGPNSLIRPIATKPVSTPNPAKSGVMTVATQLVTPTAVTSVTPATYFSKTPGGFVPITSSSTSSTKVIVSSAVSSSETVPAARKLNLPDIRAFS